MGLFSRKKKDASPVGARGAEFDDDVDDVDVDDLEESDADELENLDSDDLAAEIAGGSRRGGGPELGVPGNPGVDGPYDRSEVRDPQGRLELGALWVIGLPGMQLRLDVTEDTGAVSSVTIAHAASTMQLQAFAAPKSRGLWDEIRSEIATSVAGTGGSSQESDGRFGTELLARMPAQGPDGSTVFHPARFLGVDGPRWFLRAVVTGPAATDPAAAEPLMTVLGATVVDRGDAAMAPRELLPLVLPDAATAQSDPATEHAPLGRLERGPEITQIG